MAEPVITQIADTISIQNAVGFDVYESRQKSNTLVRSNGKCPTFHFVCYFQLTGQS